MKKHLWVGWVVMLLNQWAFADGSAQYMVPAGAGGAAPDVYSVGQAGVSGSLFFRTLGFNLPEDLVGPQNQVRLAQSGSLAGFTNFSSEYMSASCAESGVHGTCVIRYAPNYGSLLPRSGIDEFLARKYATDPATLAAMLARSREFQRDPEGVLIY